MRRDDQLVEPVVLAVVGRQLDSTEVAAERADAQTEAQARAEPAGQLADVGV